MPCDVLVDIRPKRQGTAKNGPAFDVLVARLATRQSGVVGRKQLLALGLTEGDIRHRLATGRLNRIHQGVYAVGHEALSDRGRCVAALLAAGPGAVLSHRTAAHLWKLIPSMPQLVEITLTQRRPRQREGIRIHHADHVDSTKHQALPLTTPAQTLRDAGTSRMWSEALYLGLVDRAQVAENEPTQSELEATLLAALKAAALPLPLTQQSVGPYRVDFLWPDHKLVVETDGWQAHGHQLAFERDRARDASLQANGYKVLRFTRRQVVHETLLAVVRIAQCTPHHALATPPAGG